MIFVDSTVPMYLAGRPHPHKNDAQRLLERLLLDRRKLVTSAEVFQEILHRFVALKRHAEVQPIFANLLEFVDETFPVTLEDVQRAKDIALAQPRLSARDAIHVAVMEKHGITEIFTFDQGFDHVAGIRRLG